MWRWRALPQLDNTGLAFPLMCFTAKHINGINATVNKRGQIQTAYTIQDSAIIKILSI